MLGSASRDLLQQSSESPAGRIGYLELTPFSQLEMHRADFPGFTIEKLWLRGRFPDCYLAEGDDESWGWRSDFIASYLERDLVLTYNPITFLLDAHRQELLDQSPYDLNHLAVLGGSVLICSLFVRGLLHKSVG